MKISHLLIKGFKCYEDSGEIPFHNLTVFIGENDAGKSTVFDALSIIIDNKNPRKDDFRDDCEEIELQLSLIPSVANEEIKEFIVDDKITIVRKIQKTLSSQYYCFTECFEDEDLNNFSSFNASELKLLLERLGLNKEPNQETRKIALNNYILANQDLPKQNKWKDIKYSDISNYLPIFQRFSSSDYGNPEGIIRKTLEIVYRNAFYETDEEGNEKLKPSFVNLEQEITTDLNNKLEHQLLQHVTKYGF